MPNTIYNLETRLHQFSTGLAAMSGFFAEYTGYLAGTVSPSITYKVDREISHKYYELVGETYTSGDLN